jgi:branched-chain amino acid transport system ATP-binding protein
MSSNTSNGPLLRITGLTHSFGGLRAVSDFNVAVDGNEIWGVIGPNGAGKTTVFNLITGVYKPDAGTIMLGGMDITGLPSHTVVSKGISRTFQNIRLFKSMTVLDNLRTGGYCRLTYPLFSALTRSKSFGRMERDITERATVLCEAFGITDRMHSPAASLPYGMQRKIELGRALISGPKLLLLDEPGAGLNPSELTDLTRLILKVKGDYDVSIVLIEHRMQLVMDLCDQVKVLNFGETIFSGPPSGLSADETVVKAYFGENDETSRSEEHTSELQSQSS